MTKHITQTRRSLGPYYGLWSDTNYYSDDWYVRSSLTYTWNYLRKWQLFQQRRCISDVVPTRRGQRYLIRREDNLSDLNISES